MRVVYTLPHHLEVKRLKKFLDGCEFLGGQLMKPFALWAASILVETDSLGVIVIDRTPAQCDK